MSEPVPESTSESEISPREMPSQVKAAIGIAGVFLGLQVLNGAVSAARGEVWPLQAMFGAGMAALILYGLVQGHRLAWQWGRVLGIFAGILILIGLTAAAATAEQINGMVAVVMGVGLVMGLGLIAMSQLLGRRSSREYYRLICPKCESGDVKAADFFFNSAVCHKCRHRW